MSHVIVVGAGIIGLCSAASISRKGLSVTLVGESRPGEASAAAAGMLAPSVEKSSGPAHDFALAARDLYPTWLDDLADATGIRVPLNARGVLQVAITEKGIKGLRATAAATSEWLDRDELARLEPALGHALGAVFNPGDGSVDNIVLLAALGEFVRRSDRISSVADTALTIEAGPDSVRVALGRGGRLEGDRVVVAAGAWSASVEGPFDLSMVTPSRGQVLSYKGFSLRHVTYGPRGYLVPRLGGACLAGSTMENVGFDPQTTEEGIARVRSAAEEIAPGLVGATIATSWAGLRPVTPDMLPLLGEDPMHPRIVYACGHSRNGILLAPLTGETVASIVVEEPVAHDLSQFHPARFWG